MKNILTILGCVILNISQAQNILAGWVTNAEDNSAVVGATIYIPDLKRGTTSDKNGAYLISDLPKGSFLIECRFIGFGTLVKPIQIKSKPSN